MPLHAVLFEDDPARAEVRPRLMPDHLAFLGRRRDSIRAAGPLRDTASGAPAGGLWLVDAPDAAAVESLVREDPFWPAGLRRSVRVLEWTRVFAEGKRLI